MIKKLLFAGALALAFNTMNAQVTIFEDSFETYTDFAVTGIGQWTMKDLDGKKSYGVSNYTFPNGSATLKAFQVFNQSGTTPAMTSAQFASRTGSKHMICWDVSEAPLKNNDWMISPKITLGATGNKLSFWAKPAHASYGEEKFNVLVSTTGNSDVATFTKLNASLIVTDAVVDWVEYTFDLDAYKGQNVYIAIQCVSDDQFALQIDDFKVTATTLAVSDVAKTKVSIYPNPTTEVLNVAAGSKVSAVEVFDMMGRKVSDAALVDGKVDVKNLAKGAYVLKVTAEAGSTSHKFIKN